MAGRRPNAQNISALKTKIGELSQTNVFQVSFLPPNSVFQFIKNEYKVSYAEKFELLCNSAVLPGSRLATHEQSQDFYGVRKRYAYRKQFDETLQLNFYVDINYDVITFFEGWQDYIMGLGTGFNQVSKNNLKRQNFTYRVSYPEGPNGYVTNIFVSKFEKDLRNNLLEYTFTDAFPIGFNSMPVQYGSAEVLQMTVDFAYSKYVKDVVKGVQKQSNARGTVVGSVNSRPGFVTEEILLPSGEIVTRERRL